MKRRKPRRADTKAARRARVRSLARRGAAPKQIAPYTSIPEQEVGRLLGVNRNRDERS